MLKTSKNAYFFKHLCVFLTFKTIIAPKTRTTPQALAKLCALGISRFFELFRQETGLTVYEYLTQRRLLHARDLIEKGSRATEACYRSGFRSYSSFTRSYAKIFGTTPTGRMDTAREREESYE